MDYLNVSKWLSLILVFWVGWAAPLSAQTNLPTFFDGTDTFLKSHVKNGKVDYTAIKKNPETLNKLVNQIGKMPLDDASSDQKEAFYIDAYNLLVIHSIIKNGIPSSPMDVDGFFDTLKHQVSGKKLSLDEIENNKLRKVYNDPRIHFSIVCGAVSCPPIRPFAYQPERLDEQLTKVTRTTLNSDFLRIDKAQETAHISEIFKWYKQDFLDSSDSIVAFINQYRKEAIPDDYTLDYYDYDWALNSQ